MNIHSTSKVARETRHPDNHPLDMRSQIRHGDMYIGPELAKWILSNCFYHAQESRMKSGRISILRHVVRLRRGRWLDGSQISFAKMSGGRLILVNGYHRMSAIMEFGDAAKFNVQLIDVKDGDELDSLYSLFDRAKDSRTRTKEQGSNALHFDERMEISKTLSKAIGSAVLLIKNDYRPIKFSDREKMVEYDSIEDMLDLAMAWKREAQTFDEILRAAKTTLKRKLLAGTVLAVALTTLKYQHLRAGIFWGCVAANDGLRKNMPEHTLVDWLLSSRMEGNNAEGFIAVSLAWNAFYYNKPIGTLRVGAAKGLRIAGTPVKSEG